MNVEARFYSMLRFKLNSASLELSFDQPVTVHELLDRICSSFDYDVRADLLADGGIKKGTIILIDGKNVLHLDQLDTQIDQDCVVSLFPPSGGG